MKSPVVIIGTGHRLQAGHDSYSPSQLNAFADLLDKTRRKYRVKFIAEEMSRDLLGDFGVKKTIAEDLANRKRLTHRYFDLTCEERSSLGVDRVGLHLTGQTAGLSPAQFATLENTVNQLRECVWLVRVLEVNKWPVLLICGANHVPRVEYLFNSVGKLAIIEQYDYEAEPAAAVGRS